MNGHDLAPVAVSWTLSAAVVLLAVLLVWDTVRQLRRQHEEAARRAEALLARPDVREGSPHA